MKVIVYNSGTSTVFNMPNSFIEKYGFEKGRLLNFKFRGISFISSVSVTNKLNKDGSIYKTGKVTIPKKIADYFQLRNKQQIDIKFENG